MASPVIDVFLSYKAEDRARLSPLVAALEAEGFIVWWDARIGGGANWRDDIQEHLDAARCVIVAWTKRSIGREGNFVRDEATRAQRRGIYLPIRLDPIEPPLGFGEVQAISLKGWRGDRSDPRFTALVNAIHACISGEHGPRHPTHRDKPAFSRRAVVAGGAGIGTVALAGVGGWLLLKPAAANARRIAVLPFANLSGDESQDYFAAGIAEELRSALTRLGMQVIGRASSDAVKDLDTKVAAARLDVANILTGSVRRTPAMIRVNAQLVGGKDGVEQWGQSYDRAPGDAISIQADIAQNVAQALSIALGQGAHAALTLGGTADPAAQDLIMKARRALETSENEADVRHSLALAEAAIDRDPRYAGAYATKATIHRALANAPIAPGEVTKQLTQADTAARKAIALAPEWGLAYTIRSEAETARLDFTAALRTAKRALSLSPDDPVVVASAATAVALYENVKAGLRLADRAIALDPLRAGSYGNKAFMLTLARQYPQAIEAGRKALSLAPESSGDHVPIGDAFLLLGQPVQAKAEYGSVAAEDAFRAARLALLAARTGDRAGAERILAQMKREYGAATSYQHAEIYAQLGERDQAFAELDTAVQRRDSGLAYFKLDPFLDPIRGDSRYAALLRRLKFP